MRIQEGQKILPLFRRKDQVVQGIVGQVGARGTKHVHNSYAPGGTTEGETAQDILARVPAPEAQNVLPSVLLE